MKTAREIIFSLEDRFKPEEVDDDLSILFHFDISGDNGGQFSVKIEDETCNVSEGLSGEPKCLISCAEDVYADIELGQKKCPNGAYDWGNKNQQYHGYDEIH